LAVAKYYQRNRKKEKCLCKKRIALNFEQVLKKQFFQVGNLDRKLVRSKHNCKMDYSCHFRFDGLLGLLNGWLFLFGSCLYTYLCPSRRSWAIIACIKQISVSEISRCNCTIFYPSFYPLELAECRHRVAAYGCICERKLITCSFMLSGLLLHRHLCNYFFQFFYTLLQFGQLAQCCLAA
jgi:hypothetical protein